MGGEAMWAEGMGQRGDGGRGDVGSGGGRVERDIIEMRVRHVGRKEKNTIVHKKTILKENNRVMGKRTSPKRLSQFGCVHAYGLTPVCVRE